MTGQVLRRWYVVSPAYWSGRSWDPPDPGDYGSDVVKVEAPTKRAAIVAGVRKMRAEIRQGWHNWYGSDQHPFKGMKAYDADAEDAKAMEDGEEREEGMR